MCYLNLLTGLLILVNIVIVNLLTSLEMPKPKGGRGKSAPYNTRQVRVPEPLISQVNELIEKYQSYLEDGGDAENPPDLLENKLVDKFMGVKDETVLILEEALKLKANAGGAIKERIKQVLSLLN